jgi:D-3-phosphoglycerate dehydrogenase / 2-oxoglutarate reductase
MVQILFAGLPANETYPWTKDIFGKKEVQIVSASSDQEILRSVGDADFIVCRSAPITSEVLRAGKKLKLVQKIGVRPENIDLEAAKKRGVPVATMSRLSRIAIAEHVTMFILALQRKLLQAHNGVAKGEYERLGQTPGPTRQDESLRNWLGLPGLENVSGKTLGLLGLGEIGSEVAIRACCLGMQIIYHQRHRVSVEVEHELHARYVSFEDLFRLADFLVVAVPLTKETEKMIGRKELEMMKSSAYFINVARGRVVDESSLIDVLRTRRIAGAALDVFVTEPLPKGSPLTALDNVILAPHMAVGVYGGPPGEGDYMRALTNIGRVTRGQPALNLVSIRQRRKTGRGRR